MPTDDLPLETLLAVQTEVAPEVDRNLLRSCFELQKRHQFDHDRTASSQAMERLIEEEVERTVRRESNKGSEK